MRRSVRITAGVTAGAAVVACSAAAVPWGGSVATATAAPGTATAAMAPTTHAGWGQPSGGRGHGPGGTSAGATTGSNATGAMSEDTAGALDEATAADLTYLVEEEKLAHDVYVALGERYDARQLDRIARAETTHQQAVARLLDRYGLADPTEGAALGEFTDPTLQALYDDLVAQGSQSLAAAAEVGITIERTDIADLDETIAATSAPDVVRVLQALQAGSQRHLDAFERLAATAG